MQSYFNAMVDKQKQVFHYKKIQHRNNVKQFLSGQRALKKGLVTDGLAQNVLDSSLKK